MYMLIGFFLKVINILLYDTPIYVITNQHLV